MKNNQLPANLDIIFKKALEGRIFPGAAVGITVGYGEKRKPFLKTYGYTSYKKDSTAVTETTFFDLASLTKPLVTTLAVLCLIKEKKLSLDDEIFRYLDNNIPADKKNITIRHLLNHCSGLPAHREFFYELAKIVPQERQKRVVEMILSEPVQQDVAQKDIYSDLGFMLIGVIVENISQQNLNEFVQEKIYTPLGLSQYFCFCVDDVTNKQRQTAPTEHCRWRKRVIDNEVGDENAAALGGTAGHAGLFGTVKGVLLIATHLLDQWQGREDFSGYRNDDLQLFLKRQNLVQESTWALGFDTPSPTNASAGSLISPLSIGHLGFTGVSFWIDPQKDLVMVLLTNRVHPNRENDKIKLFRPLFHDTVISSLSLA